MRFEPGAARWEAQMPPLRTVPPFITVYRALQPSFQQDVLVMGNGSGRES